MSTQAPPSLLGITYPIRKTRICLSLLMLAFVLYFLGSVVVFIPGLFLVSIYGSVGWWLSFGLVSLVVVWLAYRGYQQTLERVLADAEEVTPQTYPSLSGTLDLVEREAAKRGMEPPALYVHPEPTVNALALGGRNGGNIVLFDGLLAELNDVSELNAVVGHELTHLDNRDSVLMAALSGIKEMIVRTWTWVGYTLRTAFYQWRGVILTPREKSILKDKMRRRAELISSPIGLCEKSISRHREYIADAEGARVAGPDAMIGALRTFNNANQGPKKLGFAQSLCIHGPQNGILSRIRSTHPPIQKRIRYVQKTIR